MKVNKGYFLGRANIWNLFNKISNRLLLYGFDNYHLWIVNIFKKNANVNYQNRIGNSVLLLATINNHVQIVRKLLAKGCWLIIKIAINIKMLRSNEIISW